jgi:ribose 1,5-bisphosphokinase
MAHDMSGILLYVIGASGSGKDSLIRYARKELEGNHNIAFAHRYITRPYDAGGENHVSLSPAEFEARVARKLFSLHWYSHGLHYGIGCELNQWLAKGLTVVMNGSRAYLEQACRNYPELVPVLVHVSPDALRSRLQARGRESEYGIASRLKSANEYENIFHPKLQRLSNDRPLEESGPAFVALVRSQTGGHA